MPQRKQVNNLVSLSLPAIGELIELEALNIARRSVELFPVNHDPYEANPPMEQDDEMANTFAKISLAPPTTDMPLDRGDWMCCLSDQVEVTKQFVMSHIPWNLVDEVLYEGVLVGICKAICKRKLEWTPTVDKRKYMREMYALTKFSNILVHSKTRSLDLDKIPKILRTRMYDSLSGFHGLTTLILGSGSGGWVPDAYSDKFILALPHLKRLAHFSLKYDCTSSVLQVLSESCSKTLKILDLERSRQVKGDECVDYILAFKQVVEMNLFHTGFEVHQLSKILSHSKELRHLQRGDFLAEVVEYLEISRPQTVLQIQDFWASEDYFFHSREQMLLVSKFCPNITKAMFMFELQACDDLSILNEFPNLIDLDLWGGQFYTDGLCEYLQTHGVKLINLALVHVEEIDRKALAIISLCCPNLKKLILCNCEFEEETQSVSEDFRDADRILRREREQEVQSLIRPMLELEMVKIISHCSSDYIEFLLSQCLNVKQIYLGMNTGISDETIYKILANNCLAQLEVLSIQKAGKKMTMESVETLIMNCPKLKKIKDLTYVGGIHENEIKILQCKIRDENLNLLLEDEKSNFVDPSDSAFVRQIMQEKCPPVPELFQS